MSYKSSSSFGASDIRAYIVNARLDTFDFNTAELRKDVCNNIIPILTDISNALGNLNFDGTVTVSGPIGITGPISLASNTFVGITGFVNISGGSMGGPVSITGPIGITGLVGVTGNFQSGPITISANQFVGITGGITGTININNFPTTQVVTVSGPIGITGGITGNVGLSNWVLDPSGYQVPLDVNVISTVSVFGDVNVISSVPLDIGSIIPIEISPNQYVGVTGIVGITGGVTVLNPVQVLGDDYSGGTNTQFPIYVDVDGVQRVETVPVHIETAKYIFETDVSFVALTGAADIKLDVRGRAGWYVDTAAGLNLEWYDNSVSDPPVIAFNKMQAVFATVYNDISGAAPKIFVSTGSSVWQYETTATLYPGETYVYYYGQKAVALNPGYHPVLLTRTLLSGSGNQTDHITSIYVSFAAGSKAGIISAGLWNQDLQLQFRTTFDNNRDLTVRNNLCKLGFTGPAGNNLQTSVAQIAAGTVIGITGPVGITGTINSKITDGAQTVAVQGITGSNLNTAALNVNVTSAFRPLGSRGNIIAAGTIAAWAYNAVSAVSLLDASGSRIYGKDTYISYEDTSPAVTSNISIWGYDSTGGYHPIIANATPVTGYNTSGVASYRYFTSMANLSFFTGIRVKNDGATGISGVYLSLLTANAGSL